MPSPHLFHVGLSSFFHDLQQFAGRLEKGQERVSGEGVAVQPHTGMAVEAKRTHLDNGEIALNAASRRTVAQLCHDRTSQRGAVKRSGSVPSTLIGKYVQNSIIVPSEIYRRDSEKRRVRMSQAGENYFSNNRVRRKVCCTCSTSARIYRQGRAA